MMEHVDSTAYLHGLCALRPRMTALRLGVLVTEAGSAEAAWNAGPELLRHAGWSSDAVDVFLRHRGSWDLASEAEQLRNQDIALLPLEHAAYPILLRHVYDPPIARYVRGQPPPTEKAIAVVGSRAATPYGRAATGMLVRPLAARGLTIISGLAYGIDAEAHRATLAVHGRTIAVLGSGIDDPSLYPRAHRGLAADIIAGGGAVVSEFPPRTEPRAEFFPQRNRIIAGISHAVIIVEASKESGALITARLALNENRDVFAVPGPITSPLSTGTNRLLRDGATPALSADDILEVLALTTALDLPAGPESITDHETSANTEKMATATHSSPQTRSSPSVSLEQVFACLGTEPRHIDAVVAACTLPPHEIAASLSLLELEGRVRDIGGKQYVRC